MSSTPHSPQWTDQENKLNRDTVKLVEALDHLDLTDIYIEHFILKQKNIHFSQYLIVPFPKLNWPQDGPQQILEDQNNPMPPIRLLWCTSGFQ